MMGAGGRASAPPQSLIWGVAPGTRSLLHQTDPLRAIVAITISAALLGFITVASIEAVQMWGIYEAAAEIFGYWFNAVAFVGCVALGSAFFGMGLAMLGSGKKRAG